MHRTPPATKPLNLDSSQCQGWDALDRGTSDSPVLGQCRGAGRYEVWTGNMAAKTKAMDGIRKRFRAEPTELGIDEPRAPRRRLGSGRHLGFWEESPAPCHSRATPGRGTDESDPIGLSSTRLEFAVWWMNENWFWRRLKAPVEGWSCALQECIPSQPFVSLVAMVDGALLCIRLFAWYRLCLPSWMALRRCRSLVHPPGWHASKA